MKPSYFARLIAANVSQPNQQISRLTLHETLQYILDRDVAVARFGDGELKLALYGSGLRFQKHSRALEDALTACMLEPQPGLLPCLNNLFAETVEWRWIKQYERYPKKPDTHQTLHQPDDIMVLRRKRQQKEYLRHRKIVERETKALRWGDACVFYLGLYVESYAVGSMEVVLESFRKLFRGRRILFVAPEHPMGGDSFRAQLPIMERMGLRSAQFIDIPATDAFERSGQVLSDVLNRKGFDDLFLQAGPAATVWANQLCGRIQGRVLDVGSLNTQLRYLA